MLRGLDAAVTVGLSERHIVGLLRCIPAYEDLMTLTPATALRLLRSSIVALLCLALPAIAHAQSGAGTGFVQGVVLDPEAKAVAAVAVTIRNDETGYARVLSTDASGRFSAVAMPVGTYTLEAVVAGFAAQQVPGIVVRIGTTEQIDVHLTVASLSEVVTVSGAADRLDPRGVANGTVINERAVSELPVRGRNFTEFALLTPNIMQEANRGGLVVNGQRSINSNISIDGVDFNDSLQGNQRGGNDATFSFPQSAVREFQVVRSGAAAEVGRTASGFVNVVTKSGTNQFSGDTFYANRNERLTSADAFGNPGKNNSQHQMGASVGGPLVKDRTFLFGAIEKNLLTIPYTVRFRTPSQPVGQAPVLVPKAILDQQGSYAGKNDPVVAFLRADTQLRPNHQLNLQYTYSGLGGLNFSVDSALTDKAVSNNNMLDRKTQGIKGALTSVLSSTMLNDLRAQYAYDDRFQTPQSLLPQVDIKDFGTIGGNSDGAIVYKARRIELIDNLDLTKGRHAVRLGTDINVNPEYMVREKNRGGLYTFATMADYLAGKIQQYQQAIPAAGAKGYYDGTQKDFAVYAQDVMALRPNLTFTASLRWDGQLQPQPDRPNPKYPLTSQIPNDLAMWQPRVGLAYDIGGRGNSVLRLSSGMFDARTPGYLLQRAFTDNGVDVLLVNSANDPNVLKVLQIPNGLTAIPDGIALPLNSIYAVDPTFKNPRSFQAAASIDQRLWRSTMLTLAFTHNQTSNLQRRVDRNLFPPTVDATGTPVYPKGPTSTGGVLRPDPTIGQFNVNESTAHSRYDGLSVSVNHRLGAALQLLGNYTYALAKDDDSNERDFNRQQVLNTFDYSRDWSYSRQDIRHSMNVSGVYDLPGGVTVSAIVFARTGIPYKAVIGTDTQNDGNSNNDMPIINGKIVTRNEFRQPRFFDTDLRLLKKLSAGGRRQVILSLEVFNLTKAPNKGMDGDGESVFGKPTATPNPVTGFYYANDTAGRPTTAPSTDRFGGPRQVQLGARVTF